MWSMQLAENGKTPEQIADEMKRAKEKPADQTKPEDDRPLIITADGGKGTKTE